MIFDKIKNIDLYRGLYPNLDIAIDYIKKGEYVNLPVGKHEIVGKDVFVSVIEGMSLSVSFISEPPKKLPIPIPKVVRARPVTF